MPSVIGTPVVDGYQAVNTTFNINLPATTVAGEVLAIAVLLSEENRLLTIAGFSSSVTPITVGNSTTVQLLWKTATGSDGASVSATANGSTAINTTSFRLSADAADLLNSNAAVLVSTADTATPSIAADSISLTSGSGCLAIITGESVRDVTAYDADLNTEVSSSAAALSMHVYLDEEVVGTGNPQYDFTMSSNRVYGAVLFEINPSGLTGLTVDTPPTSVTETDTKTIVVSTPATAPTTGNTTIQLTNASGASGTVTAVSGSDPYTISFNFPRATPANYDATGYPLYLVVDAENVTTGNIPYLKPADYSVETVASVVATGPAYLAYLASPAVADTDLIVWQTLTTEESLAVSVAANTAVGIGSGQTVENTFPFYFKDASDGYAGGTVATYTFTLGTAQTDGGNISIEVPYGETGLAQSDSQVTDWVALFTDATANTLGSLSDPLLISSGSQNVSFTADGYSTLIKTITITEAAAIAPSLPATLSRNVAVGGNSITFAAATGDPTISYALTGADAGLFTESTGLTYTLASGVFTAATKASYALTLTASSIHGADAVQTITLNVVSGGGQKGIIGPIITRVIGMSTIKQSIIN